MLKFVIQLPLKLLVLLFSLLFLQLTHLFDFLKMFLGFAFLLFKEGGMFFNSLLVYLLDIVQDILLFLVDGSLSLVDFLAPLSVLLLVLNRFLNVLLTLLLGSIQFLSNFVQSDGWTLSCL